GERATLAALLQFDDEGACTIAEGDRGEVKQALVKLGYPVDDRAGYRSGNNLELRLRERTLGEAAFGLREYQRRAAEAFHAGGSDRGGCGVVVLPCGAGKTVTAMAVMHLYQTKTLVLTNSTTAVRQWIRELIEKTELPPECIGEYSAESKTIAPVTVSTYQMLTYRSTKLGVYPHFEAFMQNNWGLVVYDEVHLLPAPVFRMTADL
ncbi:MAG: DEAD/DEAH box helicase family protein, partial [Actinobacteria bacterium]|nr:DEAD/DEAH box helicase family protein [Actinomycetota bacterium]